MCRFQTKKAAPEIHSNLIPLSDPCFAIKIEDICNHQVLSLFEIHLTDVTNNSNNVSSRSYQDIEQIVLELWRCMYQIIYWYLVYLHWSIKYYSWCVFICSYNWEMYKKIALFCSNYLSDVFLCQKMIDYKRKETV